MSYPAAIETKALIEFLKDKESVAWALCDKEGNLLEKGGNEVFFGLDKVNSGQYIADYFFFLEGSLPLGGVPCEIHELELSPEKFINVYCLPAMEGDRIIFQNISDVMEIKSKVHDKAQEVMVFLDNYRKDIK